MGIQKMNNKIFMLLIPVAILIGIILFFLAVQGENKPTRLEPEKGSPDQGLHIKDDYQIYEMVILEEYELHRRDLSYYIINYVDNKAATATVSNIQAVNNKITYTVLVTPSRKTFAVILDLGMDTFTFSVPSSKYVRSTRIADYVDLKNKNSFDDPEHVED
jgi:hypothetical protein